MRIIIILLISVMTFTADARMYQWTEPGVETTQLSGKPPAWYRSEAGGPRVFVFEKGRLIDDTAVDVSADVRQRMRQEAFILVEKDRQKVKEKMAKAAEMRKKFNKEETGITKEISRDDVEENDSALDLITDTLFPEKDKKDEVNDKGAITDKSLDELRAIIADWEASQTESAKQALE